MARFEGGQVTFQDRYTLLARHCCIAVVLSLHSRPCNTLVDVYQHVSLNPSRLSHPVQRTGDLGTGPRQNITLRIPCVVLYSATLVRSDTSPCWMSKGHYVVRKNVVCGSHKKPFHTLLAAGTASRLPSSTSGPGSKVVGIPP
jgi:hypothetical protein